DLSDDLAHLRQPQTPVVIAGGTNTDEGNISQAVGLRGRAESPGTDVRGNQFSEATLNDGAPTAVYHGHFALINVHTGDVVTLVGKAGRGHASDITHSKDGNLHESTKCLALAAGGLGRHIRSHRLSAN